MNGHHATAKIAARNRVKVRKGNPRHNTAKMGDAIHESLESGSSRQFTY